MKKGILTPIITIVIAALVLCGARIGLKGIEDKNAYNQRLWLMQTVLPGSYVFTEEEYTGEDTNILSVNKGETGYVVETCVYGYAGNITMLIGVDNGGVVNGVVVTDLSETYGLGANALTDYVFLGQFLYHSDNFEIGSSEGDDAWTSATSGATSASTTNNSGVSVNVDAMSGATVTSKAIVRSINSAVGFVTGADVESAATTWGG